MWLKLSDDFSDECARRRLSDAGFRTHVEALLWTMRRETGGVITASEIRRFAESADSQSAVEELVSTGCWRRSQEGYTLLMHMEHQIEPEVIAARRGNNAERQRRKRRRDAKVEPGTPSDSLGPESLRDVPRDDTRDSGLVGTGLVGTGKTHLERGVDKDVCCLSCGVDPCACEEWAGNQDPWADNADAFVTHVSETRG